MMRKDASFFMEYACTKKNKVPQEFHFIYFLEINFALLFYSYCIIFKTSPLPIRYKRHVAFFLLVSWMARPRPNWGRPAYRVVHCDVASRDSYFPFDSYPSHSRYVISLAFQPGLESLFNTARHSPLFRSTLLSSFRKENDARKRERGDLLNCWLKSFASSPLRSYTRSESLKIEGRMGINVNKSGVYIDIIWLIYINTVSRCYCDYCIRVSIGNINEQVKTMHVDG